MVTPIIKLNIGFFISITTNLLTFSSLTISSDLRKRMREVHNAFWYY